MTMHAYGRRSKTMQSVVDAVGEHAARSLVHVYASTRIFIPTAPNLDPNHPVAKLLGMPLALRLCEKLGSSYLSIPTPESINTVVRDEQIFRRWCAGRSTRGLARDYAMSERRIQQILERAIDEGVQP
jgi:hypothetical protein